MSITGLGSYLSRLKSPNEIVVGSFPRIRRIGIVGAGTMGVEIAALNVRSGVQVLVYDNSSDVLKTFVSAVSELLGGREVTGEQVQVVESLSALQKCELLLETVTERTQVKRRVLSTLSELADEVVPIVSNTSSIPLAKLRDGGCRRVLGLHFFHPVPYRPLVEIVRTETDPELATAALGAYARQLGQVPIIVEDGPGFVANRMLGPYFTEALEMCKQGVGIAAVDEAARQFGMALGPFQLMDEIGLDTVLHAGSVLRSAFPERFPPSDVIVELLRAGDRGAKSGRGFYTYEKGEVTGVSKAVVQGGSCAEQLSSGQIADRLLLGMLLEATRLLEERRVQSPLDIDRAALYGLGFPLAKGGLLYWADGQLSTHLSQCLTSLAALGARFEPTRLFKQRLYFGNSFVN